MTAPTRQRQRAALSLASAVVLVVGSLGGFLASAGPVAAVSLISTTEGAAPVTVLPGVNKILFQQALGAGMTFRAGVFWTESANSETEYGSWSLWWSCVGLSGSAVGGQLQAPSGQAYVSVTLDAAGGGGLCTLQMWTNGAAVVNRVSVQLYSGVTSGNVVEIPAPLGSASPSGEPCASAPMPSGYTGPPIDAGVCYPQPSPSPSAPPALSAVCLSVYEDNPDWACSHASDGNDATQWVGAGWGSWVYVDVGAGVTVTGYRVRFAYSGFGLSSSDDASGGWVSRGTVAWANNEVNETGWVTLATPVTARYWRLSGDGVGQNTAIPRVDEFQLSYSSPSPSPSPLGECFWPLPVGFLGPPAPRVCGPGESPGAVSMGECFYRVPIGFIGPPAPRVCGADEAPGSYGNGAMEGWAAGVPGVDCDTVYTPGSGLPVCDGYGGSSGQGGWVPAGNECPAPGPDDLNPLDYFGWIGCVVVSLPGKFVGLVGTLVVPDGTLINAGVTALRTDVGTRVPFCWLGEVLDGMAGLLDPVAAAGAPVTLALDLPVPVVGSAGGHASVSTNTRHVAIPDVSDEMSGARTALGLFYQALGVLFGFRLINGWFSSSSS